MYGLVRMAIDMSVMGQDMIADGQTEFASGPPPMCRAVVPHLPVLDPADCYLETRWIAEACEFD